MKIFILIGDSAFFAVVSKIQGVYLSVLRIKWTSNKIRLFWHSFKKAEININIFHTSQTHIIDSNQKTEARDERDNARDERENARRARDERENARHERQTNERRKHGRENKGEGKGEHQKILTPKRRPTHF